MASRSQIEFFRFSKRLARRGYESSKRSPHRFGQLCGPHGSLFLRHPSRVRWDRRELRTSLILTSTTLFRGLADLLSISKLESFFKQ